MNSPRIPLAERMRPQSFSEVLGQTALLGKNGSLTKLLESGQTPSLLLWGPPGCGKTTIARLIGDKLGLHPVRISAVTSGVADLKKIIATARESIAAAGPATLLFVDEIHRFNKAQQDCFLGPVEDGTLILLGATTENPSFEINSALLSRLRVLALSSLSSQELEQVLERALADRELGLTQELKLSADLQNRLIEISEGDARSLLTHLEWLAMGYAGQSTLDLEQATEILTQLPRYDKNGEEHFNIISALQKSIRGSHEQASLYWLARMIEGGEDPLYIARRLVRIACEDVGLADPQAMNLAIAAKDIVHFLGAPEGALALAELVVYLATAPKSNRIYQAFNAALEEVRTSGALPVPMALRNAPTKLMREAGYGKGYIYAHDDTAGYAIQFLPDKLCHWKSYDPGDFGFEKEIRKRMEYFQRLRTNTPKQ